MNFHVGSMSVFIVTLFVCVATLQLHLHVFRLCCGFVATFLPCISLESLSQHCLSMSQHT